MAGSNLAAFFAGQIPKNNPTIAENIIDPNIALNGRANGHSLKEANIDKILIPNTTPINPPIIHNKIASTIN